MSSYIQNSRLDYVANDTLNYLVRALDANGRTRNASLIWDILTALRGPDQRTFKAEVRTQTWPYREALEVSQAEVKRATTNIIRGALGLDARFGTATKPTEDTQANAEVRKKLARIVAQADGFHFFSHAKAAFVALGLKWDEPNGPRLFPNEEEAWRENERIRRARLESCTIWTVVDGR